ncbi:hypothetical protein SPECIALG_27 [Erwinia phage vB_EamM_Special G]|uniref:Uncharacterized protein n=1 Tax=Erwinia phage vB_EamM_Special G TaxID=1815989 RepID=A0A191ZBS2_9CAUD|nr:hypothetical protein FDI00_gp027 [Erwinia phage vB_EamM_Special G]ANJ64837.1 hypothetical protein SPECIALG_27 [Erwinia phage vB_EamM_Special G]
MKLQYHAIIPIPSMPAICQQYGISREGLVRMVLEYLEGNEYQMMRRIQELPAVTDPDMTEAVVAAVSRAMLEFLDSLPEVSAGQHIRDIYLIAAHSLTAHVGFAVCDDE